MGNAASLYENETPEERVERQSWLAHLVVARVDQAFQREVFRQWCLYVDLHRVYCMNRKILPFDQRLRLIRSIFHWLLTFARSESCKSKQYQVRSMKRYYFMFWKLYVVGIKHHQAHMAYRDWKSADRGLILPSDIFNYADPLPLDVLWEQKQEQDRHEEYEEYYTSLFHSKSAPSIGMTMTARRSSRIHAKNAAAAKNKKKSSLKKRGGKKSKKSKRRTNKSVRFASLMEEVEGQKKSKAEVTFGNSREYKLSFFPTLFHVVPSVFFQPVEVSIHSIPSSSMSKPTPLSTSASTVSTSVATSSSSNLVDQKGIQYTGGGRIVSKSRHRKEMVLRSRIRFGDRIRIMYRKLSPHQMVSQLDYLFALADKNSKSHVGGKQSISMLPLIHHNRHSSTNTVSSIYASTSDLAAPVKFPQLQTQPRLEPARSRYPASMIRILGGTGNSNLYGGRDGREGRGESGDELWDLYAKPKPIRSSRGGFDCLQAEQPKSSHSEYINRTNDRFSAADQPLAGKSNTNDEQDSQSFHSHHQFHALFPE